MTTNQIKALQAHIGAVPDGFWGAKSIAACQSHLRRLMPSPNPWPKSDQASLRAFYGAPSDESRLTSLPVAGLGLLYGGRPVKSVLCHTKVAPSLLRVLTALKGHPALARYAGVYNNRSMRGGSLPSLHARGAAIDLDPDRNGNHMHWPTRATMPIEVMEAFAREGWLSAGAFWSRDGMHHQATQ